MCGPNARTNFPYNPNTIQSSNSKILSANLTAKLHKCYMASSQISNQEFKRELPPPFVAASYADAARSMVEENRPTAAEAAEQEELKLLEDDHIEQMIEELLYYGSMEFCLWDDFFEVYNVLAAMDSIYKILILFFFLNIFLNFVQKYLFSLCFFFYYYFYFYKICISIIKLF